MPDCDNSEFTSLSVDDFGDQKYITDEMLGGFCKRTMYLLAQVTELFDMADPEVCKRFSPPLIDDDLSYGLLLNSVNNTYKFSDLTSYQFIEDFSNLTYVDTIQTDAVVDTGLKKVTMVPQFNAVEKNIYCEGPWGGYTANAWWYVGYERNKSFRCTPEWIADPLGCNMPSICRAEVFTALKDGYLESIVLNLKGDANAEYDLYFEVRKCDSKGAPTGDVIATARLNHEQIHSPGLMAIPFKFGPLLLANTQYAIVLKSPFTSYDHHYGIGGWGANCKADPCPNADAWTSWDNGHTWMKHGKNEAVTYKEGEYAPQDFAYLVYTRSATATYSTTTPNWLFMKGYKSNPVKTVYLSAEVQVSSGVTEVDFYTSNDLKDWYELNEANGYSHTFDEPKNVTYIKAKLSTTNSGQTPIINGLNVHMDTNPATEGYLRGKFYNPKLSQMLGADVWSKIDAPVELDPGTTCTVDIIKETEKTDCILASVLPSGVEKCSVLTGITGINGATPSITSDYIVVSGGGTIKVVTDGSGDSTVYGLSEQTLKAGKTYEYRIAVKATDIISFYIDTEGWASQIVSSNEITSSNQVISGSFVMPENGKIVWGLHISTATTFYVGELHISEQLKTSEVPALPMLDLIVNHNDGTYTQLKEGVDYTINPDSGVIIWTDSNITYYGVIQAKYYPIWMKGLTQADFPLKCDLFEEKFTTDGVTKNYKLRATPVDPIRVVTLNGTTLKEFDDYSFDYETNILTLNVLPASGLTLDVKYTPDLQDTGLALAYTVTRPDTSKQVVIDGNSFQYRV